MKRKLTPLITPIILGIITLIFSIVVNIAANSIFFPAWANYGVLIVFTIATLITAGFQVIPQLSKIQTTKSHKKDSQQDGSVSDRSFEQDSNETSTVNDQNQIHKNVNQYEQDTPLRTSSSSLLALTYRSGRQGIYGALAEAIDAIAQAPLRLEATKLENRAKEQEMKLKEQREEQIYQIQVQEAELEKMRRQLNLELQRLELEKQHLELEKERVKFSLEIAEKMVNILHPEADAEKRALLTKALLPSLLELGDSKGLELILHLPQESKE